MSNNIEADWGEVKVYTQIPFTYQNISHPFNYSTRSSRASFYLNGDLPNLILKRLNFPKPEFFQNFKEIQTITKQNVSWAQVLGLKENTNWGSCILYEKLEIIRYQELEDIEKFQVIKQLKKQLIVLFDTGFWFKGLDEYNLNVEEGRLKIMGWDSIQRVRVNQTFRELYPWLWVI